MANLNDAYFFKKERVVSRLKDFKKISREDWKKEFIFCLLTPQSNAQRCWQAVEEIFSLKEVNEEKVRDILIRKTRFHNTKAKRVILGLKAWDEIAGKLDGDSFELRNWLAENVNGYGLKEAGHFLRNIGKSENKIAILDRHILRNLKNEGVIEDEKIKGRKGYLEMERRFIEFSKKVGVPIDELDLFWWSEENGEIFK